MPKSVRKNRNRILLWNPLKDREDMTELDPKGMICFVIDGQEFFVNIQECMRGHRLTIHHSSGPKAPNNVDMMIECGVSNVVHISAVPW